MSNFTIEEFTSYKVFLYNNMSEEHADCTIQIKLESGMAYVHFMRAELPANRVVDKGHFHDYHLYVALDKYPNYIDLLRYEKPLFFYYNLDDNISYITSSDEPVGEEEHSNG